MLDHLSNFFGFCFYIFDVIKMLLKFFVGFGSCVTGLCSRSSSKFVFVSKVKDFLKGSVFDVGIAFVTPDGQIRVAECDWMTGFL